MKKLIISIILLTVIAGASVFAWEPEDLLTFPSCYDGDDWIINFGVGLNDFEYLRRDYIWLPLFRFIVDKNVALGEEGLPFFFGGSFGYTGHGWKGAGARYFTHRIPVGFRIGYHFNWGVDNLDTYAVTTVGSTIHIHNRKGWDPDPFDWFYMGINIGARYFVAENFGFWAEVGYASHSWFEIGLSLKF